MKNIMGLMLMFWVIILFALSVFGCKSSVEIGTSYEECREFLISSYSVPDDCLHWFKGE